MWESSVSSPRDRELWDLLGNRTQGVKGQYHKIWFTLGIQGQCQKIWIYFSVIIGSCRSDFTILPTYIYPSSYILHGAILFNPRSLCPPHSSWRSRRDDARRCAHFSSDITSPWITQQLLVVKCAHRRASARQVRHEKGGGHSERGLNNIAPKWTHAVAQDFLFKNK